MNLYVDLVKFMRSEIDHILDFAPVVLPLLLPLSSFFRDFSSFFSAFVYYFLVSFFYYFLASFFSSFLLYGLLSLPSPFAFSGKDLSTLVFDFRGILLILYLVFQASKA